ncbi:helix-turn-helix transcriptional regulator [Alloiococcus sp. CFN-8]|uniref:helix-turn-helix transcriptional regulator n=1 Tax=Alloiococcus sp. CFN-8 TaxID=3416081 RepID=UPI003CE901A9
MKIDRLISITMLLLQRKNITALELSKIFEVSTRTIYRDIETINQAGIPIITTTGPSGGIGIMEEYRVDKRLFTVPDLTSLLIGLEGFHSILSDSDVKNTIAKIKGLVPEEQLEEFEQKANEIVLDMSPWIDDSRHEGYFNIFKKAIAERQILIIEYKDHKGSSTIREIEPYRLLNKNKVWYLQGYCLLRKELRTFRFYRIEKVSETYRTFEPREIDFSKLNESFYKTAPKVEVTLLFHEDNKTDIIGYCGDGVIESLKDGYYTAKVTIMDNEDGYKSIFQFGDKCECIAPKHVRDYIGSLSASIAKLYVE